jgi:hypothetical protein
MYKIIGADQKEYGPVTVEQICRWIADSRANGQTQALAEGAAEWKPLSAFPEFADALGAGPSHPVAPVPAALSTGGREAALQAVRGPAIALKVTAIIGLVLVAIGLVVNILSLAGVHLTFGLPQTGDPQLQKLFSQLGGGIGLVQDVIGAVVGVVVYLGANKMQSLQNHQYALTASILAMLPCVSPCCILGLPFGIWALTVLNKPEVKSEFS